MRQSSHTLLPSLRGSRVRISTLAKRSKNKIIRVMTRVVHLKPSRGKSDWNIKGKMMPPIEPPVAAMPVAVPCVL